MESKKSKVVNILGQEIDEQKLNGILKDVLKMRGISGEMILKLKDEKQLSKGEENLYKYNFFDCIG